MSDESLRAEERLPLVVRAACEATDLLIAEHQDTRNQLTAALARVAVLEEALRAEGRLGRVLAALVAEIDDPRNGGADLKLLREGLRVAHVIVRREWPPSDAPHTRAALGDAT